MSVHIHKRDGEVVGISINGDSLTKFCHLISIILLTFDAEEISDHYESEFEILNHIADEFTS